MKSRAMTHRVFLLNPKKLLFVLLVFSLAFFLVQQKTIGQTRAASSIPAFPGAEGGGAVTVGGRGGRIIEVTNLNESGPGSFKEACEASGPRIVVFRVGGTIRLTDGIYITNPYITIAGQTAPGGGILIRATEFAHTAVLIQTHDVVMRYIRIRHGRGPVGSNHGCIFVREGSYNVIIDHCSLSWGSDENLTMYSVSDQLRNVTVSWNIIGEGLYGTTTDYHSAGIIVGSVNSPDLLEDVSIHHNLLPHNQFRNPHLDNKSAEVINNIVYDWIWWAMRMSGGIEVDIVGNIFKYGPSGIDESLTTRHGIIWSNTYIHGVPGPPSIYIKGNKGYYQSDPDADNWGMMDEIANYHALGHPPSRDFERLTPRDSPFPITTHHVSELEGILFAEVGASRRLDENGNWVMNRDAVDSRYILEYQNGTGTVPSHEDDVGGFPTIASGTPYTDSDHDGMADNWELTNFNTLDRGSPDNSSSDFDGDGYTDLEEYLNGTSPKDNVPTPTPTPTPTSSPTPTPIPTGTPTPDATATPTFVELSIDEPLFAGATIVKGNGIPGALCVVRDLDDLRIVATGSVNREGRYEIDITSVLATYQLSGLETGHRIQAESEGQIYQAIVQPQITVQVFLPFVSKE